MADLTPTVDKSDETLAAEIREMQMLIRLNCDELRTRGYSVGAWLTPGRDRHDSDDRYAPERPYTFQFIKGRVVAEEKRL